MHSLIIFSVHLVIIISTGECCLQNLPEFLNQGGGGIPRIPSGTLAVIPQYYFSCTGRVTQWGAFVEPQSIFEVYSLNFQVYRNSSVGGRCYDLVGENFFDQVSLDDSEDEQSRRSQRSLLLSVPEEEQILVQPGDIVGFFVTEEDGGDRGVELDLDVDDEEGNDLLVFTQTDLSSPTPTTCRVDLQDFTNTNGGPVITAVVETITMSPPTPSPPGQPTLATTETPSPKTITPFPTPTPLPFLTVSPTLAVSPPSSSTPQETSSHPTPTTTPTDSTLPSSANSDPSDTLIIVVVAAVLALLIVLILVAVVTVALKVRSLFRKETPTGDRTVSETDADAFEMLKNEAYIGNTRAIPTVRNEAYDDADAIETERNQAYSTTSETIPTAQNVAYTPVEPSDQEGVVQDSDQLVYDYPRLL